MPISGVSGNKRCRLQEGDSKFPGQCNVPEDVVVEIMARLPVKPLIRFKCVCKRWFFIIGSDHFAAKQLAAGRSSDYDKFDCLLSNFILASNGCEFSLYSLDTFLGSYPSRRVLKFSWLHETSFAGPLDGILCFKVHLYKMGELFIVWNPATGVGSSSSSWKALDLSYFFDGSRCIDVDAMNDTLPSMVSSANGRMLSMPGRYRVLGNNGSYSDVLSVISFDSSDEIYIQTPMSPSCKFQTSYYTDMDRLIYCLNHGATCALIFCPPSAPRSKEVWVLIGCGVSGSWTKQISMNFNLYPWCRVVDDRYANNVYYKQSLVSIPQIRVEEDDSVRSDIHYSVIEPCFSTTIHHRRCYIRRMQSGIPVIKRCRLQVGISQLPEDVVIEILARLPVKSLIRFKCICKRWFSLLGSDHMAAKQLATGRSSDDDHNGKLDCLLVGPVRIDVKEFEFSLYYFDTLLGSYSSRRLIKITRLSPGPSFMERRMQLTVAAPLDGMLCLKARVFDNKETLVLWNLATGEAKQIPSLINLIDFVGLGRDPRTNQYKILVISLDCKNTSGSGRAFNSIKAYVYSLGGGSSSWRVLDLSYFFDGSRWIAMHARPTPSMPSMIASADGRMLSMLGKHKLLGSNGSSTPNSLFSFDSCDEVYIQTPLPPRKYTKGECLLLRPCPDHETTCTLIFAPPSYEVRPMEIWVLKGFGAIGSWTKQISVGFEDHALWGLSCNGKKTTINYPPIGGNTWPYVHYRQNPIDYFRMILPFVHYRQSLVSIPKISVNQDNCIKSDPSFCIVETYPSGRTLFTF
ncbi:hypothetical protein Dimus_032547 [Dionaea muscipula]